MHKIVHSRAEKLKKVIHLVDLNKKVDFDPETATFILVPCNCKFMADFDRCEVDEILYNVNSYILEQNYKKGYEIPFLGNFGFFIVRKLQELTKDNEFVEVLNNGDVDIVGQAITMKLNFFQPFKTILEQINVTLADVEKHRKVKLGRIVYLKAASTKLKTDGRKRK